jgi:hypothetical protein
VKDTDEQNTLRTVLENEFPEPATHFKNKTGNITDITDSWENANEIETGSLGCFVGKERVLHKVRTRNLRDYSV